MADYLRTLAARALGELPVVRPRQPSRFEPVISADVGPLDTLEVDELAAAHAPGRDDPAMRREPAPPPARPAVGTATVTRDSRRRTQEMAPATRVLDAPRLRFAEPRAPAIVADIAEADSPPRHHAAMPPDQVQTPRPLAVRQPEALPITAPRLPSTQHISAPILRETAAPLRETAHISHGDVGASVSAAPTEVAARVAQPGRVESVETTAHRVTVVHQELDERIAPASDGGAPAITVSIGRIEVRASRPEPARTVAHAPRPQPRMTLDAFLNRQGRGR